MGTYRLEISGGNLRARGNIFAENVPETPVLRDVIVRSGRSSKLLVLAKGSYVYQATVRGNGDGKIMLCSYQDGLVASGPADITADQAHTFVCFAPAD